MRMKSSTVPPAQQSPWSSANRDASGRFASKNKVNTSGKVNLKETINATIKTVSVVKAKDLISKTVDNPFDRINGKFMSAEKITNKPFSSIPEIYKPTLSYTGFPLCCGAGIISGFSSIRKEFGKYKPDQILDLEMAAVLRTAARNRHGLVFAIVTQAQMQARPSLHDALLKAGFQATARSGNPNHGNDTNLISYICITGGGTHGFLNGADLKKVLPDAPEIVPNNWGGSTVT